MEGQNSLFHLSARTSRYDSHVLIESVQAMRDLGATLAQQLIAGDIIVLRGNLGAGKTAFTQGIGRALEIKDVTSPTFVIARTHKGNDSQAGWELASGNRSFS